MTFFDSIKFLSPISSSWKWVKKKLKKNPKLGKSLIKTGLIEKGDDRDSVYSQSVLDFEELGKPDVIVAIFMETSVKQSFLNDYFNDTNGSVFIELKTLINVDLKYRWLLDNKYNLEDEIEVFRELFDVNAKASKIPKDQEQIRLLKEILHTSRTNKLKEEKVSALFLIEMPKEEKYIERTYNKFGEKNIGFWISEDMALKEKLIDILSTHHKLVILGNAGSGKSVDLINLAYKLQEDDIYIPIFKRLKFLLNKPVEDFLPIGWQELPKNQLVIILDGLDEVPTDHFNTVILNINQFSLNNPELRILLSCRTTHYQLPIKGFNGSIAGFDVYEISDLGNSDIIDYSEKQYKIDGKKFLEDSYKDGYYDLIRKPYFLKELLAIYSPFTSYPQSRIHVFEKILDRIFIFDQNHFQNTIDYTDLKLKILVLLRWIALSMEIMGKNIITREELFIILGNDDDYKLLKFFPGFNLEVNENVEYWGFVHNNIQELLAAQVLINEEFSKILPIISFEPSYLTLNPSWSNTLNFLMGLLPKENILLEEFLQWIIKNEQYEALIQFEKEKISKDIRASVFLKIYEKYTGKDIWINSTKYKYEDLAKFGETEGNIDFILNEIKASKSKYSLSNSLQLLKYFNQLSSDQKETAVAVLLGVINSETEVQTISDAIDTLTELKLFNEEILDNLVVLFSDNNSQHIRMAIYRAILEMQMQDKYLNYFLNGYVLDHRNIRSETYSLGGLSHYLNEGIKLSKTPKSVKDILKFIVETDGIEYSYDFKDVFKQLVENGVIAYQLDKTLYSDFFSVLVSLSRHFRKEAMQDCLKFFSETKTTEKLLNRLINKLEIEKNEYYDIISELSDDVAYGIVLKKYENGDLTAANINTYYKILLFWGNKDKADVFFELVKKELNIAIEKPEQIDWQKIGIEKSIGEFEIIFSNELFSNEVKKIFKTFNKESLTNDELYELRRESYKSVDIDEIFKLPAINLLRDFSRYKGQVARTEAMEFVLNKDGFERYQIEQIFSYLKNNNTLVCTSEQFEFIKKWCNKTLKEFDFKTAIYTSSSGGISFKWQSVCLYYFRQKLSLEYPYDILLDMISFEFPDNNNPSGFDYILEKIGKEKVTERVLDNLKTFKFIFSYVLHNHVNYLIDNKIVIGNDLIAEKILDVSIDLSTKLSILDKFSKSLRSDTILKHLIVRTNEFDLVEALSKDIIQHSPKDVFLIDFLVKLLVSEIDYSKRFRIANLLIKLGSIIGLEEMKNIFISGEYSSWNFLSFQSVNLYKSPDGLDILFEMLTHCYALDKKIELHESDLRYIDSHIRGIIYEIGLLSETNLNIVKEKYLDFMRTNFEKYPEVRFTTTIIENMEHQFRLNKAKSYTAKDAVNKLKQLIE